MNKITVGEMIAMLGEEQAVRALELAFYRKFHEPRQKKMHEIRKALQMLSEKVYQQHFEDLHELSVKYGKQSEADIRAALLVAKMPPPMDFFGRDTREYRPEAK